MGTALVVDEDREAAIREMEAVITEGQGRTIEFRWTAKDGAPRWVESNVVPTRDDAGKHHRPLRGFTMDITSRKDAEEALRQSEVRFRHMADTAPVLIWLADTEMKCTFFNQRVIEFTGRRPGRTLRRRVARGNPPGRPGQMLRNVLGRV